MPKGAGLTKPMKLSADLADVVGKKEASRAECIKQLWAYIKKNNLQDPENKQFFNPDKKMAKVFNFCLFLLNYCFRLQCTEVESAPLINFQKLFSNKVFYILKLVKKFKFHIWMNISGSKSVKKSQKFL